MYSISHVTEIKIYLLTYLLYEYDQSNLSTTFARSQIMLTDKLTNGSLKPHLVKALEILNCVIFSQIAKYIS